MHRVDPPRQCSDREEELYGIFLNLTASMTLFLVLYMNIETPALLHHPEYLTLP